MNQNHKFFDVKSLILFLKRLDWIIELRLLLPPIKAMETCSEDDLSPLESTFLAFKSTNVLIFCGEITVLSRWSFPCIFSSWKGSLRKGFDYFLTLNWDCLMIEPFLVWFDSELSVIIRSYFCLVVLKSNELFIFIDYFFFLSFSSIIFCFFKSSV